MQTLCFESLLYSPDSVSLKIPFIAVWLRNKLSQWSLRFKKLCQMLWCLVPQQDISNMVPISSSPKSLANYLMKAAQSPKQIIHLHKEPLFCKLIYNKITGNMQYHNPFSNKGANKASTSTTSGTAGGCLVLWHVEAYSQLFF